MEIISCHTARNCSIANFRGVNDLNPHKFELPLTRKVPFYNAIGSCFRLDRLRLSRLDQCQSSRTMCSLDTYENVDDSSVVSENYETYVPKVEIPSLPDKGNGDNAALISSCFWEWKPKLNVHYEKSGSENSKDSPAVLFLPGFGVGSFHFEKQLRDLGCDYRVWALDFVGQGMSLPFQDPTFRFRDRNEDASDNGEISFWGFGDESEIWAKELVFSVDLWRDQVRCFIEEVIKEPVYLVGNSLGGFVAIYFAACHPELVKGVTLLNATPFWGFLPNPRKSPTLSKLFPWSGTFPLPSTIRILIKLLWEKISDPRTIAEILKQVYADYSTKGDEVFSRIVKTTQHPAAAASFASIIFAPKGQLSFDESLTRCRMNNTPICLMYGKEDPWVRPVWGLQVKRKVPEAPYYEISPAGHCPHDEVPEVVNFLLRGWIQNLESDGYVMLPLLDDGPKGAIDDVIKDLEFTREGLGKSVRVQFHGFEFSMWKWLNYQLKPMFKERA
ncbi:hypothetical protein ABFS83_14G168000 [Erythranthe nasuta]